jgi:DNA repair protein RecO (recombination protein O)
MADVADGRLAAPRPGRRLTCSAVVWRRADFRESSRVVTLLSREHGRLVALAKGAHRADSSCLGRLDFLNEVRVTLSPDRGGLRILERVVLQREPRALRAGRRYLAACHLCELVDAALLTEPVEPALFDLLHGGLLLLERCPLAAIPHVVVGLELLYLQHAGALPDLQHCAACGADLASSAFHDSNGALACRRHAPAPRTPVGKQSLEHLQRLRRLPGKLWPELGSRRLPPGASVLPGLWLQRALERRGRLRRHIFAAAAAEPALDSHA